MVAAMKPVEPLTWVVAAAIVCAMAWTMDASAAERADVAAGRAIAARNCGVCHATAAGRSPLPDAPPFRRLYRRYRPGGLGALLQEGMLPPDEPADEGAQVRHPRMPIVPLGPDEVAELKAYLRSLDPRLDRRPHP